MSYNKMINEDVEDNSRSPPSYTQTNEALPPPLAALPFQQNAFDRQAGDIFVANNELPSIAIQGHASIIKNDIDPESLEFKQFAFTDASIRRGFIRKVYLILMAQLIFTSGIISIFLFHTPTKLFVQRYPYILLLTLIMNLIVIIALTCCETARRVFPMNLICLALFTVSNSIMLGALSSTIDVELVFLAVLITSVLCLTLSIYAMQTKYDFTTCGGFIICSLMCLIIFGFVAIAYSNLLLYTIYSGIGALLACIYLIYDTQLIIGGQHKYAFNPEEYILAALTLYIDVVRIFLYVLRLLALSSRK